MAKFKGTAAANTIYGTSLADTLDGGAGADTLIGGLGNDTYVIDNAGDIFTEKANGGIDTLNSFITLNLIELEKSYFENITLLGAANLNAGGSGLANIIIGNNGDNVITGYFGNDSLRGGDGNDLLYSAGPVSNPGYTDGGSGDPITDPIQIMGANLAFTGDLGYGLFKDNNTLEGGNGSDTLFGGNGVNKLIGGNGDDTYVVFLNSARKFSDVITETATGGSDTLFVFDSSNDILSNTVITLGAHIENLQAGGLSSTATINGNGLDNHIYGGFYDDIINGGVGIDTLEGGNGNDTYLIDNTSDVIIEGFDVSFGQFGNDTILLSRTTGSSYLLDENVENLTLTNKIAYTVIGNELDNALLGNAAMNTLIGNDGNDYLEGLAGNDSLVGGAGNDYLDGGTAADVLNGGLGDDTYVLDNVSDVISDAGGLDTVILSVGTPSPGGFIVYDVPTEIENVSIVGNLALYLDFTQQIGDVNNVAFGNAANNFFYTGNGDDYIDGDAGKDVITAGDGNDTLIGGLGNDELRGQGGADVFVFESALSSTTNVDIIKDFSGGDRVWLDNAIFTKLIDEGTMTSINYVPVTGNETSGYDQNDYIIYNSETKALYYDADGFGGAASIKVATFESPGFIDENSFIVV